METYSNERGLLSLEASIAVTVFIFLMLFMYSFFVVFESRNAIGHAVLATTNSLSLDAYGNTKLGDADTVAQIFYGVYGSAGNDSEFVDRRTWYEDAATEDGGISADFESAIRTRFLAYLGGGSGSQAEEVLERYHVQGGVEGLDFSNSHTDGENLYLSVQYTIEYEFQVFNLDVLHMEQKACSKLWT